MIDETEDKKAAFENPVFEKLLKDYTILCTKYLDLIDGPSLGGYIISLATQTMFHSSETPREALRLLNLSLQRGINEHEMGKHD